MWVDANTDGGGDMTGRGREIDSEIEQKFTQTDIGVVNNLGGHLQDQLNKLEADFRDSLARRCC